MITSALPTLPALPALPTLQATTYPISTIPSTIIYSTNSTYPTGYHCLLYYSTFLILLHAPLHTIPTLPTLPPYSYPTLLSTQLPTIPTLPTLLLLPNPTLPYSQVNTVLLGHMSWIMFLQLRGRQTQDNDANRSGNNALFL